MVAKFEALFLELLRARAGKGDQEWEHDMDVVVQVNGGKARTQKNRFNNLTQITIF